MEPLPCLAGIGSRSSAPHGALCALGCQVVLFERATFLVISHTCMDSGGQRVRDPHRFEKISNIIKQFKLSCGSVELDACFFQTNFFPCAIGSLSSLCLCLVCSQARTLSLARSVHLRNRLRRSESMFAAQLSLHTHTHTNRKSASQFQSMEVRNENFAAYIDYFTTNTYVMVIMADATIRTLLDRDPMGVPRIHSGVGSTHSAGTCAHACVCGGGDIVPYLTRCSIMCLHALVFGLLRQRRPPLCSTSATPESISSVSRVCKA